MRILLLSGGLDSTALAFQLRPDLAITFDYGQLAAASEIGAAETICGELLIKHQVIRIDCSPISLGDMSASGRVAGRGRNSEWWPFRNQLLITFAAAAVIELEDAELILGSVSSDSVHRDGTSDFVRSMNNLLSLQEGAVSLKAPALYKTTQELLRDAQVPSGLLGWTFSCHRGNLACGDCRGCTKRRVALSEIGMQA